MFKINRKSLPKLIVSFIILLMVGLTRCSLNGITLGGGGGGGSSPNEARPTGTPVYSGSFSGLNGQSVSGIAYIFQNAATYILRLESFSAPSGTNLQVQVYSSTSSSPVYTVTLTFNSGNQNFSFSTLTGSKFTTVYVVNPTIIGSNNIYGSALLLPIQ